jgi:hypothetical protein
MNMPAFLSILAGMLGMLAGILLLVFRERVLGFIRDRFQRIYREDRLLEPEINSRLPKMPAVVTVAIGFAAISAGFVAMGLNAVI